MDISVDNELKSLYITACMKLSNKEYSKNLLNAVDTSYTERSISDHMSIEKIIITGELAREYMLLFVMVNFGSYKADIDTKWIKDKWSGYSRALIRKVDYAEEFGFDHEFLEFLIEIEDDYVKFSAKDRIDYPYLQKIYPLNKPIPDNEIDRMNYLVGMDIKYIERYASMIRLTDDDNLNLLLDLITFKTITKKRIIKLYKKYKSVKPSMAHFIIIMEKCKKRREKALKNIISTYYDLGVKPHNNILYGILPTRSWRGRSTIRNVTNHIIDLKKGIDSTKDIEPIKKKPVFKKKKPKKEIYTDSSDSDMESYNDSYSESESDNNVSDDSMLDDLRKNKKATVKKAIYKDSSDSDSNSDVSNVSVSDNSLSSSCKNKKKATVKKVNNKKNTVKKIISNESLTELYKSNVYKN